MFIELWIFFFIVFAILNTQSYINWVDDFSPMFIELWIFFFIVFAILSTQSCSNSPILRTPLIILLNYLD